MTTHRLRCNIFGLLNTAREQLTIYRKLNALRTVDEDGERSRFRDHVELEDIADIIDQLQDYNNPEECLDELIENLKALYHNNTEVEDFLYIYCLKEDNPTCPTEQQLLDTLLWLQLQRVPLNFIDKHMVLQYEKRLDPSDDVFRDAWRDDMDPTGELRRVAESLLKKLMF